VRAVGRVPGRRPRVALQPAEGRGAQGTVELAIAGAVEPVADDRARGGGNGAGPASMAKAAASGGGRGGTRR
jgi:hypothetical protein